MHCLKGALVAVMALGAMLVAVQRAAAVTAEGTLLTNVATGTYMSPDFTPYEVSYSVTANVLVAFPFLQVRKTSTPSAACSGGTVTFCVFAVNNSLYTSAFNVTLRDLVDSGFAPYNYINPSYNAWRSDPGNTTITYGYGKGGVSPTFLWINAEPPAGQEVPLILGWNLDVLGPGQSVHICFSVSIF